MAAAEPQRRKRGTGSVRYHSPSKLWRASLPKALDPAEHAEYFATHEAATAWLDGELARRARLAAGPSSDMPLKDYLLGYLHLVSVSEEWSPTTVKSRMLHIAYLSEYHVRPLSSITRIDLQKIVVAMQSAPPEDAAESSTGVARRKKSGSGHIHNVVGFWRRAFQAAVDDELILRNPAAKLSLPKKRVERRQSWSPEEARLLVSKLVGHPYEASYALIFGCALRIGETRGLAWDDVDEANSRAWIWQQADGPRMLQRVKGGQGKWVTLLGPVMAALRRQRERQTWPAVYVSEHAPGVRVSRETLVKHLKRLAAEVGVRQFAPHAGRHAVGNILGAGNIPLATIADRLRHTSRMVTADWYLESDAAAEGEATRLLEMLFSGVPDEDTG